jgi:hypothetical protein
MPRTGSLGKTESIDCNLLDPIPLLARCPAAHGFVIDWSRIVAAAVRIGPPRTQRSCVCDQRNCAVPASLHLCRRRQLRPARCAARHAATPNSQPDHSKVLFICKSSVYVLQRSCLITELNNIYVLVWFAIYISLFIYFTSRGFFWWGICISRAICYEDENTRHLVLFSRLVWPLTLRLKILIRMMK